MARPVTSRYHDDFEARIAELLEWEARVDAIATQATNRDWMRNRQCEAILLFAFSHWERLVEKLFCARLANDLAPFGRDVALPLSGRTTLPLAQALMTGGRYFSVNSFSDLLGRAKKHLAQHSFDRVAQTDREALDTVHALRNHIAHASRGSLKRLRKRLTRRREVGLHLRARDRKSGCTRLRCCLEMFLRVSKAMR